MIGSRRLWLCALAVPLLLSASATGRPEAAVRCSKFELPMTAPSLFFVGRATAATREAPVRGAGERLEQRFSGSVPAQVFGVERVGGTDAALVSPESPQVVVVPWGYAGDCTPERWPSPMWVDAGTTGLVHGQLRAREHWVDGMPTIDTHEPYQLPYPRRHSSAMTADDAFTLLTLLPQLDDLDAQGPAALRPLHTWLRERPELVRAVPGQIRRGARVPDGARLSACRRRTARCAPEHAADRRRRSSLPVLSRASAAAPVSPS